MDTAHEFILIRMKGTLLNLGALGVFASAFFFLSFAL
jgi:hypothetical protein